MSQSFAAAINCIDGRVQIPVINYIKKNYGVDFVDVITEPGPNKVLAEKSDLGKVGFIKERVQVSVLKHASKVVAVVGHYDCAGNPVDKKTHIEQIKQAVKTVESWKLAVQVIGLWVDKNFVVWEIN